MRRLLPLPFLALPLVALGCGSQVDDNALVLFEGEHTIYSIVDPEPHEASKRLCEGTPAYVDAYTGSLKEQFGASEVRRIRYAWVPEGVASIGACESGIGGTACASNGETVSGLPALEHELVHTVRQLGAPRTHGFLEEGVAEFLGGRQPEGETPSTSMLAETIVALETGSDWTRKRLALAGHFTAFLVFGLGLRVDDLGAFADAGENLAGEVAEFAGLSETELIDLYESYPRTTNHAFRDSRISCALATDSGTTFVDGVFQLRDSVDCGDSAAVGETGSYVEREYRFVTTDRGCYRVESSTDAPETRLWIEECAPSMDRTVVLLGFASALLLDAAEHTLLVRTAGGDGNGSFSLRLEYDPSVVPGDCF